MDELSTDEAIRKLERAMMSISPQAREVFLAKRLDDLPYAEIARRAGISVRDVELYMVEALAAIEESLQP